MSIFKKISSLFSKDKPEIISEVVENNSPLDTGILLKTEKLELNKIINDGELSPEEILMLALTDEKDTSNDFFPGYWEYTYNVNPQILFTQLVNRGFYTKEKSLLLTLKRKTVEELKEILRENNLKVSGKKQELVDRILNELSEKQLNSIKLIEVYKINDTAKEILANNEHILFFHNSPMEISIYTAHDFKNKNPNFSPIEIARHLGEIQAKRHISNGNWGLYRNLKHSLSEIEMTVQNFEDALTLLFEVCYIDLSGISNSFDPEFMEIYEKSFFPYTKSSCTLAPGIVNKIRKLKVKFNLSDIELKNLFVKSMANYQIPFHLFTKEESADVLIAEINHDEEQLKHIYNLAEKRYFSKYV